jgi:hypothetical protein
MDTTQNALDAVRNWWNSRPPVSRNNGLPAQGTLTGALVLLENLQEDYQLDINKHLTKGLAQIRGAGKDRTRKILARFGQEGTQLAEGGRTNRGLVGQMETLIAALKTLDLKSMQPTERNTVLQALQGFLVQQLREYSKRKRVGFTYHADNSTWRSVHDLLVEAQKLGKIGQLAQYLVGAKLALRFPDKDIRNDKFSSQDFDNPGDYAVNDTAFHVTVSATKGHFDKCKRNAEQGYSPYLLVPDSTLFVTQQAAEGTLPGKITVLSIESFVAQNIDELSVFSKGERISGFRRLLEKYNERVSAIESDQSLLVEIPHNLLAD